VGRFNEKVRELEDRYDEDTSVLKEGNSRLSKEL
jgi:hypothetical protein